MRKVRNGDDREMNYKSELIKRIKIHRDHGLNIVEHGHTFNEIMSTIIDILDRLEKLEDASNKTPSEGK